MNRVTNGLTRQKFKRVVKKLSKGFKSQNQTAEQIIQSLQDSYIGRKLKKRNLRSSWILHINSACKLLNISYSSFIGNLKKKNILLNRKILSFLIIKDFSTFFLLADLAKNII